MRFVILRGFSGSGSNWQKRNNNIEWKIGKLTHVHFLLVRVFRSPSDSIIYLIFDGIARIGCVCVSLGCVGRVCRFGGSCVWVFGEYNYVSPRIDKRRARQDKVLQMPNIDTRAVRVCRDIWGVCMWKLNLCGLCVKMHITCTQLKFCGPTAPPTFQPPQLPIK